MLVKTFLESKLKEYYNKEYIVVDNIRKREFGYGVFGRKIANRNLSFNNDKELNQFLRIQHPFYFSYSVAYYKYPNAKLNKKKYLGGDLVFEFDADDIPTKCKKILQVAIMTLEDGKCNNAYKLKCFCNGKPHLIHKYLSCKR